jgi:hypothetical protein
MQMRQQEAMEANERQGSREQIRSSDARAQTTETSWTRWAE